MPDEDIWAIIAYLRHGLRPVANDVQDSDRPPEGWSGMYAEVGHGTHPATPFPSANEVGG